MRRHLVIPPETSRAIRGLGLERESLLGLLNLVYEELEEHSDNHKHLRDSAKPDVRFNYEVTIWDHGQPRAFRFTVDDALAPDRLFLLAVEEI